MKHKILLLLIISVSLFSCRKSDFDFSKLKTTEWNPNLALPLVNASYSVYDVLANFDNSELVVVDPNTGFIALVYKGQLFSFKPSDIFNLVDESYNYQMQLDAQNSANLNLGQSINGNISETFLFNFEDDEVQIKEIRFKGGQFELNVQSSFQNAVNLQISIPNLTLNNQPYTSTISLNQSQNFVSQVINLNGYKLNFSPPNQGSFSVQYQIVGDAQSVVNGNESLDFDIGFRDMKFKHVKGNLGTREIISDQDSIDLRIFKKIFNGYFQFNNPSIKLNIENSFGVPINLNINDLYSINTESNIVTEILLGNFPNPFPIPSPSTIGFLTESEQLIDKNNSNIQTLITPTPKVLYVGIGGTSNPNPNPNVDNFITDDSYLKIDVELELPLDGYAYGFFILDTVAVNITDNIEEVLSVLFRLNITNGFPLDLDAQLYFVDENFQILDSLVNETEAIIPSGLTNNEGRVITPTNKITDIVITQEKVPNIFNAKYIIIRADANTKDALNSPPFNVRFYEDYKIDFRLGMQIKGNVLF